MSEISSAASLCLVFLSKLTLASRSALILYSSGLLPIFLLSQRLLETRQLAAVGGCPDQVEAVVHVDLVLHSGWAGRVEQLPLSHD